MSEKLEQIIELVSDYISEQHENETWTPGEDWVHTRARFLMKKNTSPLYVKY